MDYQFTVDPQSGKGKVTISGDITPQGLAELLEAAWADPAYSRCATALWNFLEARTEMRFDDLVQLGEWIANAKHNRGAKTIAIVATNDVIFGVGRMFHAIQPESGWKVCIFRNEPDAVAWLDAQDAL